MPLSSRRKRRTDGFTLIELLVVISIIGLLIALILPAVQAAREAARRVQCTNNLKQIALATLNYEAVWSTLPRGGFLQSPAPGVGLTNPDGSLNVSGNLFLSILPYLEQKPLYNSINFDVNIFTAINATVSANGVGALWCPSDAGVANPQTLPDGNFYDPGPFTMYYSSYSGNLGTWGMRPVNNTLMNGPFVGEDSIPLQSVGDGQSNTIGFGEHTGTILPATERGDWHWWTSGWFGDALFVTLYPMNPQRTMANVVLPGSSSTEAYATAASSMHPGGCNFAFLDGSVRFLKDTIDCWRIDPASGLPSGISFNSAGQVSVARGTKFPVYQALSTRNGGEVIDSASY
jgi:prepilin-type N-terminal cleavage/methylation domain-containing protein/prepilin-type processing-associated H-X9-DG protein